MSISIEQIQIWLAMYETWLEIIVHTFFFLGNSFDQMNEFHADYSSMFLSYTFFSTGHELD